MALIKDLPRIETTAVYRAGLFDGEGSFTGYWLKNMNGKRIITPETGIVPVLSMGNTNLDLLAVMVTAYGGQVCRMKKREGHRQAWTWTLRGAARVHAATLDMFPHLVGKRLQASTMLVLTSAFRQRKGSTPVSQEDCITRRFCLTRLRALNVRGEKVAAA